MKEADFVVDPNDFTVVECPSMYFPGFRQTHVCLRIWLLYDEMLVAMNWNWNCSYVVLSMLTRTKPSWFSGQQDEALQIENPHATSTDAQRLPEDVIEQASVSSHALMQARTNANHEGLAFHKREIKGGRAPMTPNDSKLRSAHNSKTGQEAAKAPPLNSMREDQHDSHSREGLRQALPPPAAAVSPCPSANSSPLNSVRRHPVSGKSAADGRHMPFLIHKLQSRPTEDTLAKLADCISTLDSNVWHEYCSQVIPSALPTSSITESDSLQQVSVWITASDL